MIGISSERVNNRVFVGGEPLFPMVVTAGPKATRRKGFTLRFGGNSRNGQNQKHWQDLTS